MSAMSGNVGRDGREPPLSPTTPSRILVVEDDPDIRQVLCVYLRHSGFEVFSAMDGSEAIRLIEQSAPHLIVLDLMMRPVDGWEVLHWLRAHRLALPVLVLTALYRLDEQVQGFEEGAIEYITKPTQPSKIVERIRTILGLNAEQRTMLQRKRMDERRSIMERVELPSDEFAL